MTAIATILGREILDSRGNPTVEVDIALDGGAFGPEGGLASTLALTIAVLVARRWAGKDRS